MSLYFVYQNLINLIMLLIDVYTKITTWGEGSGYICMYRGGYICMYRGGYILSGRGSLHCHI